MDKPRKRSITIAGHATSISLEAPFWDAIRDIAAQQDMSAQDLIAEIDNSKRMASLSSAIRVYILSWYQDKANET
ncbi:MAG: ribbon-helix-helix domain-containing protein [Pseudomonadota bacterium]|jgi:predicted DNA-binding ribbon-helix-helix protein|nr:ribbon-helix-helix domain-containing protein [Pseudomonadota bacterium]MEC7092414.1 ribbon-helix-helix domain-containing protein [Pseudomonadota bacterium]MEC7184207.1 ribbon-helix-helix domain-containing protein [Pseudomonadota bacterium]MEC7475414.1 ribbon-helix-helix domain-containing protein [Pseudomonadota bacterium]MEC7552609.1 ribbon-helix-helix domain-containing protein [Pseudomonadota bacterium]|tara:strand:+ start:548 stop:772 length:225 start_codon:yes stop_codon:yes gene_type:complete